jgi:hypothetical protein
MLEGGVKQLQLQLNLYTKDTQANLKTYPLWAVGLYIQVKIICMRLPFIENDLLYRGTLWQHLSCL